MTSGLETEWNYSGRKGRDGQKKKTGKANERKGKVKGERWTRGERGAPAAHGAYIGNIIIIIINLQGRHSTGDQQSELYTVRRYNIQ